MAEAVTEPTPPEPERLEGLNRQFSEIYESSEITEALRAVFLGQADQSAQDLFCKTGSLTVNKNGFDFVFSPFNKRLRSYQVERLIPGQRINSSLNLTVSQQGVRGYEVSADGANKRYFGEKVAMDKAEHLLKTWSTPKKQILLPAL